MRRLPAELVPRVPEPVRKVARTAIWGFGRATSRWRPLPHFLVLGAQKAGTTALYAYLRWHPAITGPSWKEVSFFDRHWWRGPAWYRGQFPLRSGTRLVGEASPSYLFHPLAPERVGALVPDARLVALLRDPVARAYSHYQHEVALGREPLSFEDALAAEPERTRGEEARLVADARAFSRAWWDHTYVARGLYAEQLERWLAAGRDLRRDPRVPRRRAPRPPGVPAHLRPRVRRHAGGDAARARRALRGAESAAPGAARARPRLGVSATGLSPRSTSTRC
jgi:hypothetical protein